MRLLLPEAIKNHSEYRIQVKVYLFRQLIVSIWRKASTLKLVLTYPSAAPVLETDVPCRQPRVPSSVTGQSHILVSGTELHSYVMLKLVSTRSLQLQLQPYIIHPHFPFPFHISGPVHSPSTPGLIRFELVSRILDTPAAPVVPPIPPDSALSALSVALTPSSQ